MACWARHAFAYTGHLSDGTTLRPRAIPIVLSEGRAFGAAAARWHERGHTLLAAIDGAEALRRSLDEDEREHPVFVDQRVVVEERLLELYAHYIDITEPLPNLTRLEDEVITAIPSRTGRHHSNRFRFQCLIDGWTELDTGPWLVEFKLRKRLHTVQQIAASRQIRWYAWALREVKGIDPVGVLVEQRLNEVPRAGADPQERPGVARHQPADHARALRRGLPGHRRATGPGRARPLRGHRLAAARADPVPGRRAR